MFIPTKEQGANIAERSDTPVFVTDRKLLDEQAERFLAAFKPLGAKIFYAIKTNYNPHIVRALKEAGVSGIDAVSVGEVRLALELGYAPEAVIYTPSNASTEELQEVGNWNVLQNLGSLSELRRYGKLFPGREVSIRICPEIGAGEFDKIRTGGLDNKFGLALSDIAEARAICKEANVSIVGVHSHVGSGFYDTVAFIKSAELVCKVARELPDVRFIDVGGGFGVPYRPDQKGIDIEEVARALAGIIEPFRASRPNAINLYIEPGKYLVSESTVLLARITTMKEKDGKTYVGLDTGFNHLIRPAMYGAYHHIVNVSKADGPLKQVAVVGNLCETGDIFSKEMTLVDPEEDDLVAILVTGGHGSAMSSNYNLRPLASEVLIEANGEMLLTRRRQAYADMMALYEPLSGS